MVEKNGFENLSLKDSVIIQGVFERISNGLSTQGLDPSNLQLGTTQIFSAFALSRGYSAELGAKMHEQGLFPNLETWLGDPRVLSELGTIYGIIHPKLQTHTGQMMFSPGKNVRLIVIAGIRNYLKLLENNRAESLSIDSEINLGTSVFETRQVLEGLEKENEDI